MTDRCSCIIPHCRRTKKYDGDGDWVDGMWIPFARWICQNHWRYVPVELKALLRASRRRIKKFGTMRYLKLHMYLFKKAERKVIEVAGGI